MIDEFKCVKVIVAGTRTFDDYALLCRKLDKLLNKWTSDEIIIVSGTARGADLLGEKWAYDGGATTVKRFHPEIDRYGVPKAYFVRNQEMVDYADRAIFFWNGRSPGTMDCINRAKRKGMKVKIIHY